MISERTTIRDKDKEKYHKKRLEESIAYVEIDQVGTQEKAEKLEDFKLKQ